MQLGRIAAAAIVLLGSSVAAGYAGQRGHSGNHGPSTHAKSVATAPKPHGPAATSHGHAPTARAPRPSPHTTVSTKKTPLTTATTRTTATSTVTRTAPVTTIDFTATPVAQKLAKNTALASKIQSRLQAAGYTGTLDQAAYGFRNLGQFNAATNVSRNLGLSFEQLKLQMTGQMVKPDGTVLRANLNPDGSVTLVPLAEATNPAPLKSLGQAIQTTKTTTAPSTTQATTTSR
jgi:hypothetical protein